MVTGSTAGIGLAIADRMAQEGGHLIICSRKQKNVDEAIKSIGETIKKSGSKGTVEGLAVNVGAADQRKKLIDFISTKYCRLDVLVPNAAVSPHFG